MKSLQLFAFFLHLNLLFKLKLLLKKELLPDVYEVSDDPVVEVTVLANLGSGIVATDGVIECDLRMPPETGLVEGSLEKEEESLSSLDEYAASILSLKFFSNNSTNA